MFIKRLITVLILIPVVIVLILFTSKAVFQIITAVFSLFAAWEWAILSGIKQTYNRLVYVISMLAALSVIQFIPHIYLLWFGLLWWLLAIYLLWNFVRKQNPKRYVFWFSLMGFFAIIPCWVGLNSLRNGMHGTWWILWFLFLLWATDTGAYLVGRRWGQRKLAPRLSPGKTREGVLGGIGMMLIFAIIGLWVLHIPASETLLYLVITIVMSLFSIIGDLFESMMKRLHGVKDSGALFPGHGGFLDRMDSMLAAAPVYALFVLLSGLMQ